MITGCQGTVALGARHTFEIWIKVPFDARSISIPDAGYFNVTSFRVGPEEYVQDGNLIDGRTFIEHFPQLKIRRVLPGECMRITVQNRAAGSQWFSCSILGVEP